jgi:hypothetical protein
MDVDAFPKILSALGQYRVHILVFCLVLFLGLTFSHPELLLNDEWITVNQLHQLHEGHQILFNEGKYGFTENGTMNAYFAARGNRLAYSLFLPLLSLPALWLVDLLGNNFVFSILYLWTFLLLYIILFLHYCCPEYSYLGTWRWTPPAAGISFILFFTNLFYYTPFSVTSSGSFPEAIAIVFTNNMLLAIAGVVLYETNRTLFENTVFSVFGTIVCLLSSSYIFWASGCKDHILTMLLFAGVLLCVVKFGKTRNAWFLPLAFLCTGLLAWARPELALWVFFVTGGVSLFYFIEEIRIRIKAESVVILCSPLFTILGAIPFFLNNFLITGNPLLPPNTLYFSDEISDVVTRVTIPSLSPGTGTPSGSLIHIILTKTSIGSTNIPGDMFGVLFHPINGSMGLFSLQPFFLVMAFMAVILILTGRMYFSKKEKEIMAVLAVIAIAVLIAYANNLNQLNISRGINPDIRYLSPLYIPLTLLGLVIMRNSELTKANPFRILAMAFGFAAFGIPISIYLTSVAYADPAVALQLDAPLSAAFSSIIFLSAGISLIMLASNFFFWHRESISGTISAALFALPFIWQIDISVRFWGFAATGQGYPAWIPVIRILYTSLSSPLFAH